MTRLMTFIDGTWLYSNTNTLAETYGDPGYRVDYGRLQDVLVDRASDMIGGVSVDAVRTHLFGSYAKNCDPVDEEHVRRRLDFFRHLERNYHYEVETYAVDFHGRRLRKSDRDPNDAFTPKEKCVDIALASAMVQMASIDAFDVAIAVIGDRDFIPALQRVRSLGKRVVITSIASSCSHEIADPYDRQRVKDTDIVWLDTLLEDIKVRHEKHRLECQSPTHSGPREVWTQFYPRRGQKFYCDSCREKYMEEQGSNGFTTGPSAISQEVMSRSQVGDKLEGVITSVRLDKRYAFARSTDGEDFFVHESDLASGVDLDMLSESVRVAFQVVEVPGTTKPGGRANGLTMLDQAVGLAVNW